MHGGEKKNDKIDAEKIARLLKGGMLAEAYVYPRGTRETRDLLRRRMYLVRHRAELITHVENTNSQYNEIHRIERFASAGQFLSYARLVAGQASSAGKRLGAMGRKIGNMHLKWAFSEATCLLIRQSPAAK